MGDGKWLIEEGADFEEPSHLWSHIHCGPFAETALEEEAHMGCAFEPHFGVTDHFAWVVRMLLDVTDRFEAVEVVAWDMGHGGRV